MNKSIRNKCLVFSGTAGEAWKFVCSMRPVSDFHGRSQCFQLCLHFDAVGRQGHPAQRRVGPENNDSDPLLCNS